MAKKKKKKLRNGEEIVSFNFRLPVSLRERAEKFRDDKLKNVFPGPTWSMTSVMIHLLDKGLKREGF